LWAGNIFYDSTAGLSSFHSASALVSLFECFQIALPPPLVAVCNAIMRKAAHIVEYAVFTILLYRAASGMSILTWRSSLARWCVLTAAAYSLTDELHQLFVPGRGASLLDCALDCAGSFAAMFMLYRRVLPAQGRAAAPSITS
jgi:VanZ family protein